jgi:hypothetical protein
MSVTVGPGRVGLTFGVEEEVPARYVVGETVQETYYGQRWWL